MPRPVSRTKNWTRSLISSAREQDCAFARRVAHGVAEQVVEDAAQGAAVGVDVGEIGEGRDLNLDPLGRGLLDAAVAGLLQSMRWGAGFRA